MKIAELKSKGGFIGQELVKKPISWKHKIGEEEVTEDFSVFVKRQSFGLLESVFSGSEDRARASQMIASSIRLGEKGEEEISYEMAYQLDPSLAALFVAAINEVNGTGQAAKN